MKEHAKDMCKDHLEIISSVFKVVYPNDPGYLWTKLQASTAIREMLVEETMCPHLIEAILKLWQKCTRMQKHGTQGGRFYCVGHCKLQSSISLYSWIGAILLHHG